MSHIDREEPGVATELSDFPTKFTSNKSLKYAASFCVKPQMIDGAMSEARDELSSHRDKTSATLEFTTTIHEYDLLHELQLVFDPHGEGKQQNPDLYSRKSLLQRESLKFDRRIRDTLNQLWSLIDDNLDGTLSMREFGRFHKKCALVLDAGHSETDWQINFQEDWKSDTKGKESMTKQDFVSSMFELADKWTDNISAEDYHKFMTTVLLDAISSKGSDGARRYRSDDELKNGTKKGMSAEEQALKAARMKKKQIEIMKRLARVPVRRSLPQMRIMSDAASAIAATAAAAPYTNEEGPYIDQLPSYPITSMLGEHTQESSTRSTIEPKTMDFGTLERSATQNSNTGGGRQQTHIQRQISNLLLQAANTQRHIKPQNEEPRIEPIRIRRQSSLLHQLLNPSQASKNQQPIDIRSLQRRKAQQRESENKKTHEQETQSDTNTRRRAFSLEPISGGISLSAADTHQQRAVELSTTAHTLDRGNVSGLLLLQRQSTQERRPSDPGNNVWGTDTNRPRRGSRNSDPGTTCTRRRSRDVDSALRHVTTTRRGRLSRDVDAGRGGILGGGARQRGNRFPPVFDQPLARQSVSNRYSFTSDSLAVRSETLH